MVFNLQLIQFTIYTIEVCRAPLSFEINSLRTVGLLFFKIFFVMKINYVLKVIGKDKHNTKKIVFILF